MKYSAVALVALVAVASAQNINDIPVCAIPCIENATTKSSDCSITDYKCICKNMEDIVPTATNCVLSECGNDVALNQVLPATEKFCKEVEQGGGAEAPASSAAPAPESSAPAPTPSSAPPAESSSSAAPEPSSSGYPTSFSSSVVPSAEPTSAQPSSTATSTPPAITAGAAHVAGSLGLLVLGAVAAL